MKIEPDPSLAPVLQSMLRQANVENSIPSVLRCGPKEKAEELSLDALLVITKAITSVNFPLGVPRKILQPSPLELITKETKNRFKLLMQNQYAWEAATGNDP